MAARTLRVTLTMTVRDFTDKEWEEAKEADFLAEDDEEPGSVVAELTPRDLAAPLCDALDSVHNEEIFAGTGMFCHIENAAVESIGWAEDPTDAR